MRHPDTDLLEFPKFHKCIKLDIIRIVMVTRVRVRVRVMDEMLSLIKLVLY